MIVQDCFFYLCHIQIIELKKIKIALRFGMAAALGGGGWAVMDRRTEESLQFETGGDGGMAQGLKIWVGK
jgi:hypothetical protein